MFGLHISDDSLIVALATIIAAIISAVSVIVTYNMGKRKKLVETKNALLNQRILESQNQNPYTTVSSEKIFIDSLDFSDIKEIKILAHTGNILVDSLRIALNSSSFRGNSPPKIKILLKDPLSEHPDRRDKIVRTYDSIESFYKYRQDISVEIRFYSSLQTFRGIFVTHNDNKRDCFFSAYNWTKTYDNITKCSFLTTKAVPKGFVWRGESGQEPDFLQITENWFNYLWGPGIIHTIAFDFDDTLFTTYNDHIEAWEKAIYKIYESNPDVLHLFEPILKGLVKSNSSLQNYVVEKFLEYNNADEIAAHIFQNDNNFKNFMEMINEFRYDHRMSKVLSRDSSITEKNINQRLIPHVLENLLKLREIGYTLFVTSLTDEMLIEKVLTKSNLESLFTGILGRSDYNFKKNLELSAKESLLLKVCSLCGIPTYRLLYIGDHRNDIIAARHVGASFAEARLIEPQQSHIINIHDIDYPHFTKYDQLPLILNTIENNAYQKISDELEELTYKIHNKKEINGKLQ